jgi:CheY-like chemotaxis protein
MQVLTNFLSNASKYTQSGGEISLVFRQMRRLDGQVHMQFRVKDTGKGMNPEFLSRIFKPFVQESASTTRKYGGTGLGMAIADNMVRLMGGHIVVDTELGRGSEFAVYLPFEIAPGDQSFDTVKEEKKNKEEISFEGMKILMAEDNAINAEIACELFKMEGAELEIAENGKVAVEKIKNCPDGYYDLVFMDIQMPEMDGWTAAKEIRALDSEYAKNVPIFALSANAFTEDKRHSAEVGMNGHISKPIDFEELKSELEKKLDM